MTSRDALFRPQALQAQRTHWLGEIVLIRPTSFSVISGLTAIIAVAFAVFFAVGSYTRKTVVDGQLAPVGGVLKLHAAQPGVVMKRLIAEGAAVTKGQVLFVLSSERQGGGGEGIDTRLIEQERSRQGSLERQIDQTRRLHKQQSDDLAQQIADLEREDDRFASEIAEERQRIEIAREVATRYEGLAAKDYISRDQLQAKRADLIEQNLRLENTLHERESLARETATRRHDLAELQLKQKTELDSLGRDVISSEQQLTEGQAKREIAVVAPVDGIVESVQAETGQYVDPAHPLATVVPKNVDLVAYLYVPSKSIGFTKVGDPVLLRYAAYPYQKFGQQRGTITALSKAAASPAEFEHLAGGIPGMDAARAAELYYQVTVKIDAQQVKAYGTAWPLSSGMALEASIQRDTRKLYEWALEPLLSQRGKLST